MTAHACAPVNTLDGHSHVCNEHGIKNFGMKLLNGLFVFLLFIKLYFEHHIGILLLLWLYATIIYVNGCITEDVICRLSGRAPWYCLCASTFSLLYASLIHYSWRSHEVYSIFLFIPPTTPPSTWNSVFGTVVLLDCTVKAVVSLLKSLLIVMPSAVLSNYNLGSALAAVEMCSLIMRNVYPSLPWVLFILGVGSPQKGSLFNSIVLTSLYCILKVACLVYHARTLKTTCRMLSGPPFKTQSLTNSEQSCTLCFKKYTHAGVLQCSHMLCEQCVGSWCSLFNFCPVCGVHYPAQTQWRDGSMDLFIQFY
ncbi:hypothetical protein EG68_08110 [Paragonimus skrjabini miyazakii]|uniref:RING-type domain-containing protein n=1 Tax=Paragonimus skrjabini miyazakii TaxID=59628 RepID=A0A8S9YP92_9TREM|nr:hypothetical protein EG68_08110 [Paragonimus skrjabini miyazakii]